MSIRVLKRNTKPHDIFDDLESLLWVLLFFAIHYFKFDGIFDMGVFDEAVTVADKERGMTSIGGASKLLWLQMPEITFKCKPLQDFFANFRSFHEERHWKRAAALDSEDEQKALEEYEAEVQKDVYSLASYFNDVLDDPNVDWTGQEALGIPSENDGGQPDEDMADVDDENDLQPEPRATNPPNKTGKSDRKRKREEPEADSADGRRRKRTAASQDNAGQVVVKPVARAPRAPRRRRVPPAPCERVLRPRTRK